ncbi:homeodomain transcription factor ste12 [Rhizopus stolonifer]|uniref:Homeodomain transcription factor ste12 n=1 Tax=Rhizopus stolonifer TaxID=4846 RepID=A0A367JWV0_RHIST|nr:homeodomain transcription factor ste12 [Rhizopus stolonifer]
MANNSVPEESFDQHHSLVPTNRLQPPTTENTEERLTQIDELKYFLGTATNDWDSHCKVRAFALPTGESISCVFWNDLFHVTGTDIVRTLLYRFHLFGRPVTNLKKFEEGIFSDLRNLKPGMDASLEEPKSEFLEMLYKNNCIRTQKKQKVFYWFSVPHDRLFLDALERDLKREKIGLETTSLAIAEPATSLTLDTAQEMFDQLRKSMSLSAVAAAQAMDESTLTSANTSPQIHHTLLNTTADDLPSSHDYENDWSSWNEAFESERQPDQDLSSDKHLSPVLPSLPFDAFDQDRNQRIFGAFSLFEGSPTYKQRQRKRTSSMHQHHNQLELAAINAGLAVDPHMFSDESNPEKTFVCPLSRCGRVFKRLEHLKRHFRIHTMERPYACNMCGKSFSRTDNLTQHKKTHTRSRSSSLVSRKDAKDKNASGDEKSRIETNSSRLRRSHLKRNASSCSKIDTYFYNAIVNSQCNSPTISPQVLSAKANGDEVFDMSGLDVVDMPPVHDMPQDILPTHDMVLTSEYYPPSFVWNEGTLEKPYPLTASSSTSSLVNEHIPYSYYDDSFYKEQQPSSWYSSAASSPTLCPSMYDQPSLSEIYPWNL